MSPPTSCPVIEVSHLPSAASFYASVTQPLGLQYLSSSSSALPPSPTRLYFGHQREPVFALEQASLATPRRQPLLTRLAAPSPAAVESFYKKALLANNAQREHGIQKTSDDEEARATIKDLDGNMIEAVYSSHAGRRIPTMETASTEKEARRVLAWQEEVARNTVSSDVHSSDVYGGPRSPPVYRRAETFPRMAAAAERPMRLVRRETVTTEQYRNEGDRDRVAIEGRAHGGTGISGMKLVGTLLGAAAGAAVAYAMVRSESPPRLAGPPRRASYGDHGHGHGSDYPHPRPAVERVPARSYVSTRPPSRYPIAPPPPALSRALTEDMARIEERSHASRRSARDDEKGGSRVRSRSEVGSRYDRPLTLLPSRPRSPGGASHRSLRSHHSKRDSERDSYVSARSQRTESTVKPVYVTPAPSKVSTTTIRVVPRDDERRSELSHARHVPLPRSEISYARHVPLPRSEISYARHIPLPRSEISARHGPLPPSIVSGRSYAGSVAPSDSISSVGSKRERSRFRERMSARERW